MKILHCYAKRCCIKKPPVSSCVIHNGHASDFFLLERGVRQACPLSGFLFAIGIELFARALQKDPIIRGIKVGQNGFGARSRVCPPFNEAVRRLQGS